MAQRVLTALGYAVAAIAAAFAASGVPVGWEGWIGLVVTFVVAFWGKFSTSTRVIAMDRKVWTAAEKAANQ